jgi:peroxiredoxin
MSEAESFAEGPSAVADERTTSPLVGVSLPSLTLDSTMGPVNLAELSAGLLVLFVYPHATGLPDAPVSSWNMIPGARGCTAQACSFRDHHQRLRHLGAEVAGLSIQTAEAQRAFAERVGLHYRLISDPRMQLAAVPGLPTFTAEGQTFYRRLTLVAEDGRVTKIFSPVLEPEGNADEVATWLEVRNRE